MVVSLVQDRLQQPDVRERGCLLDGFPRTTDQAQALLKQVRVEGVFFLQVPEKSLIQRAAQRRIDPRTGEIYHLEFVPPPSDVLPHLVPRDRDDEHSFRQRIEVFKAHVRRVLPFFSGRVWKLDAALEPQVIFQKICRALDHLEAPEQETAEVPHSQHSQHSCSICFDEPADFLVSPCGHQCGCRECLVAVQQHSGCCPICRGPVREIQQVFRCGREVSSVSASDAVKRSLEPVAQAMHPDLLEKLDGTVNGAAEDDDWSEDEPAGDQDLVKLKIEPCKDQTCAGEAKVMISADVADLMKREPADVCCLVDVSGSMGSMATYEDADGNVKDDGLSVLDIVKHAVKTVIKALGPQDRLALVAFDDKQRTALALTDMCDRGQELALEALDGLRPGGQTNIWGGMKAAMDALREGAASSKRHQAILLLTDGQPNIKPPRGHLRELADYKDTHPGFHFQLNTFGFGYSLDSELLLELAEEGHGTYAFIPDAVIVGTTFVNSVANVLSTFSQSVTLSLMPMNGAQLAGPVMGCFKENDESWGRAVHLGPLQYGQSRDVVVGLLLPQPEGQPEEGQVYLEAVLSIPTLSGLEEVSGKALTSLTLKANVEAVVAEARADAVSTGHIAIASAMGNEGKAAGEQVAALSSRLAEAEKESQRLSGSGSPSDSPDGRLLALRSDVDGRMSKALKGKQRFNRWGKHYLRALTRSHQLQMCTNFMDPGLQVYGGAMFRSLRDVGDRIFLELPPPKRQEAPRARTSCSQATPAPASPNMTTYYAGAGGGCFDPSSTVQVLRSAAEGLAEVSVQLRDLRAGEEVRVADGFATVRCVVKIDRPCGKPLVVMPDGLKLTPRHPVRVGSEWLPAFRLPGSTLLPSFAGCVYNVLLDRCHILLVGGVQCITWGHGFDGPLHHNFFGKEVVNALSASHGWKDGHVHVAGRLRDAAGNVVGFDFAEDAQEAESEFQSSEWMPSRLAKQQEVTWVV
ncbi:unnamed protein product [Symbiodinium natans]|uniref:Adenylate kinase n=1 Tax=Symbiodinium natans TaxID=878477 RepID=A0A812R9L6_9DINO|nr:unnamed protein product [Symbiodinium natans]